MTKRRKVIGIEPSVIELIEKRKVEFPMTTAVAEAFIIHNYGYKLLIEEWGTKAVIWGKDGMVFEEGNKDMESSNYEMIEMFVKEPLRKKRLPKK